MLTMIIAAVAVGEGEVWRWEEQACNIPNNGFRGTKPNGLSTMCCTNPNWEGTCYNNPLKLCMVSSVTHRCCAVEEGDHFCANLGQDECKLGTLDEATIIEWCGDTDNTLKPAALAAIAVTPIAIVAAAIAVL